MFRRDTDDPAAARQTAEDIPAGAAEAVTLPDAAQKIGISIGIAVYSGHETNYSELFKRADTALYQAKADPVNRCRICE